MYEGEDVLGRKPGCLSKRSWKPLTRPEAVFMGFSSVGDDIVDGIGEREREIEAVQEGIENNSAYN